MKYLLSSTSLLMVSRPRTAAVLSTSSLKPLFFAHSSPGVVLLRPCRLAQSQLSACILLFMNRLGTQGSRPRVDWSSVFGFSPRREGVVRPILPASLVER